MCVSPNVLCVLQFFHNLLGKSVTHSHTLQGFPCSRHYADEGRKHGPFNRQRAPDPKDSLTACKIAVTPALLTS